MGCRRPQADDLYRDGLDEWSRKRAVDVRYAFSQKNERSKEAKYIQHCFWDDRKDVVEAYGYGAKVLICGSSRMADGVREASKMWLENMEQRVTPKSGDEVEKWLVELRNEIFISDAFG